MAPSAQLTGAPHRTLHDQYTPINHHDSPLAAEPERIRKRRRMESKRKAPSSSDGSCSSPPPATSSAAAALHDEHALLAAYETRPTRPKRSSSERSKEFRAKRKKYEGQLQHEVDLLRREVTELNMRRNIWQEKRVHMRDNVSGELIKLVREYYLVFQHGLALSGTSGASTDNPRAKYQLDFLSRAMDPNVQVGGNVGIPALVEQWRFYTTAHASLFVEVGDVTVFGPHDDPVVLLRSRVHVQFSRKSFQVMYPGALQNEELIRKFVDKNVVYDCLTHFRFTPDGRIRFYDHNLGLLEGLLQLGESLEDVLELVRHFDCKSLSRWTMDDTNHQQPAHPPLDFQVKIESVSVAVHTQEDVKRVLSPTGSSSSSTESDNENQRNCDRRKLSMNFLLS